MEKSDKSAWQRGRETREMVKLEFFWDLSLPSCPYPTTGTPEWQKRARNRATVLHPMSRFVDEEEAEIQVGSGLSGVTEQAVKDAPAAENGGEEGAAATAADDADAGDDAKNGHHHYRKRKSLQEQLLNNRMYKYRERRKKMEKQNSSFKMRKDTREFYGKLGAEKQAKKQAERETYERELALFRRAKEKQQKKEQRQQPEQQPPDKQSPPIARTVAYSDSDSE